VLPGEQLQTTPLFCKSPVIEAWRNTGMPPVIVAGGGEVNATVMVGEVEPELLELPLPPPQATKAAVMLRQIRARIDL
jgi:hypothetical protein